MLKQKSIFTVIAVALLLTSCDNDDNGVREYGKGTVFFACEAQSDLEQIITKAMSDYVIPDSIIPDIDLLKLNITGTYLDKETNTDVVYDEDFASLMEYNQDVPYLVSGNYTATFSYGDVAVENDTNACFGGSVDFTIVARKSIEKDVKVKLCNSAIRLKTTTEFDNYFRDAEFQVATSNGTIFNFTSADDAIYYVEAGSELTLSGIAKKKHNDGVEVRFSAKAIGNTKTTTVSTIIIDSESTGGLELNITLGEIESGVKLDDQELNPNA